MVLKIYSTKELIDFARAFRTIYVANLMPTPSPPATAAKGKLALGELDAAIKSGDRSKLEQLPPMWKDLAARCDWPDDPRKMLQ